MPLKLSCPSCQKSLTVPEHLAGRTGKCPGCGASIKVPPLPTAPSYQSAPRQSAPSAASPEDRSEAQPRPKASCAAEPQSLTWAAKRGWLLAAIVGTQLLPNFGGQVGAGGAWFFALIGFALGFVLFKTVTEPAQAVTNLGLKVFAFTATVGIISVLLFQELAAAINEADVQRVGGSAKWTVLLWIVRIIGYAYGTAFNGGPDEGFVVSLISMFISVGLCEELVKLAPVAWLLGNKRITTAKDTYFIGAMSGLGFGIGESLNFAFSQFIPAGAPASVFVTRYIGAAFGHGVYTLLATYSLYAKRTSIPDLNSRNGHWELVALAVLCSFVSAVPHAFFNTFAGFGLLPLAVLVDGATVWTVVNLLRSSIEPNIPITCATPADRETVEPIRRRATFPASARSLFMNPWLLGGVGVVIGCLLFIPPSLPSNAVPAASISPAELRAAMVGKYEDVPGTLASISVSFQYPRYVRHAVAGGLRFAGQFEVVDDHPSLHAAGLQRAGTFALLTETPFSGPPEILLVQPILNDGRSLAGLRIVGEGNVRWSAEQQVVIHRVGSPEMTETKPFVPRNLPEFLPSLPASNVERSEPAKTAPGELPDFMPRVNSNF